MVSTAPTNTIEGYLASLVYLASKMAAKISFQSNLEFTDQNNDTVVWFF